MTTTSNWTTCYRHSTKRFACSVHYFSMTPFETSTLWSSAAAYAAFRVATEDTQLKLQRVGTPGEMDIIPIKKGGMVVFDMVGYARSPELFPAPETFDPQRWSQGRAFNYKNAASPRALTKDDSLLFSQGPRNCLGKKFAQVEAVAFLTILLRDYRVEPICLPGEGPKEWERRILTPVIGLTMHIRDKVPLRLVRRTPVGVA